MNAISSQASSLLSSHELLEATRYLLSTRDHLVEVLNGLSDPQWHFKPAPDSWSIVEILEHVVIIENRVHTIIGQMPTAPAAEPDRAHARVEAIIVAEVPKRSNKFQAPPPVCPSCQWSPAEALARFLKSRKRTGELLATAPALRGHVLPHPVFGAWDGYQWILATAAHSVRHADQILEVKNCSGFPKAQVAASISLH